MVGREGGRKEGGKHRIDGRRERLCVCVWTGEGLRLIAEPKAHTIVRPG